MIRRTERLALLGSRGARLYHLIIGTTGRLIDRMEHRSLRTLKCVGLFPCGFESGCWARTLRDGGATRVLPAGPANCRPRLVKARMSCEASKAVLRLSTNVAGESTPALNEIPAESRLWQQRQVRY